MKIVRAALAIVALVILAAVFLWAFALLGDFYDRSRRRAVIAIGTSIGLLVAGLAVGVLHYGFPVF